MIISETDAGKMVELAREQSAQLGKALSIAVVDYGGHIVTIVRLDGARPMTPTIALSKAYSAAVMQRPTSMLKDWSSHDPVFFAQVGRMGQYPIVATEGGVTLKRGGEFLGGLGISGGTAGEDQQVCDAILAALGFENDFAEWAGSKK
jgi:uncharacterized protein GlcG (DUF336 family)